MPIRRQRTTTRTDVWGLGVVLYELVTGAPPFARASAPETFTAILRDEPPALDRVAAGVPEALARLVARALAKEPAERPAGAREVASELERIGRVLTAEAGVQTLPMKALTARSAFQSRERISRTDPAIIVTPLLGSWPSLIGTRPYTPYSPLNAAWPMGYRRSASAPADP